MNIGRNITHVLFAISLVACGPGKQLQPPAYYSNPAPVDTTKLRFDGFYHEFSGRGYKAENYTAMNPVILTPKNKAYVVHGAHTRTDSSLFECSYYKSLKPDWFGVYTVEGNKISAFAPVTVSMAGGSYYTTQYLHFTGTIINKELIAGWKAVPPFPRRIRKVIIANPQNESLFEGHDIKFVMADSVKCLHE